MTPFFNNDSQKLIDSVFDWLRGAVVSEKNQILVDLNGRKKAFFFEFPVRAGQRPKEIKGGLEKDGFSFIIRHPSNESIGQANESIGQADLLFSSPEIEVWETQNGKKQRGNFLTAEEKKFSVDFIRSVLKKFLSGNFVLYRPDPCKPILESLKVDYTQKFFNRSLFNLGVAFWIGGALRGSYVLESPRFLIEGLTEAAIGAARDPRFKPLASEELSQLNIEVTLFSDLRIHLSRRTKRKNLILADKGHILKYKNSRGYFLPEVFNVFRFSGYDDFLQKLAHEKAGLKSVDLKKTEIKLFEVQDFMESAEGKILDMWGPAVCPRIDQDEVSFLRQRMKMAGDYFLKTQEEDGNFPPVTDVLSGKKTQIDLPRCSFSAWSLAELGNYFNEKKYTESARKTFYYLMRFLGDSELAFCKNKNLSLIFAYAGQLALALQKGEKGGIYFKEAARLADLILSAKNSYEFEPIKFQQIAAFFIQMSHFDQRHLARSAYFLGRSATIFKKLEKNKKNLNLASYAEQANVAQNLFCLTGELEFKNIYLTTANWLLANQIICGPDGQFGPFRESPVSDFVYSRGTGKIFESLGQFEQFRPKIKKALRWLFFMQYTQDNTFFVAPETRERIIGGFRHDYVNSEAWIDSAAHFILGAIRYLRSLQDQDSIKGSLDA